MQKQNKLISSRLSDVFLHLKIICHIYVPWSKTLECISNLPWHSISRFLRICSFIHHHSFFIQSRFTGHSIWSIQKSMGSNQGWLLRNDRWHPSYSLLTTAWKELEPWLEINVCPFIHSAFISHSPQSHVLEAGFFSIVCIVCLVNVMQLTSRKWSKQIFQSSG